MVCWHMWLQNKTALYQRSAVGLHLLYAWIIICVSARPDLFVLLGDEKRFW